MSYMPTPPDYRGVSLIQSQSPALPYGWPKLPDQRKFGSVARKKLRFKLHMFQNSKKSSGFLCLYYGFWLLFLAWCTLFIANKKKKVSSLLLLWRGGGIGGTRGGDQSLPLSVPRSPASRTFVPLQVNQEDQKAGFNFQTMPKLNILVHFPVHFFVQWVSTNYWDYCFLYLCSRSQPSYISIFPPPALPLPALSRFLPSPVPSSPGLLLPCPLRIYKRESDWMSIQPIEDHDR